MAHALQRIVDAAGDPASPLYRKAGGSLRTSTRATLNEMDNRLIENEHSTDVESTVVEGGVESKHSTDVESPPPPSRVCMSVHPGLDI
jgi:hypothetical protein